MDILGSGMCITESEPAGWCCYHRSADGSGCDVTDCVDHHGFDDSSADQVWFRKEQNRTCGSCRYCNGCRDCIEKGSRIASITGWFYNGEAESGDGCAAVGWKLRAGNCGNCAVIRNQS